MLHYFKKFQSLFFPYTCILCGSKTTTGQDLCEACLNDLPWITQACVRCCKPLKLSNSICGSCLKAPPSYDRTIALFNYQEPVAYLITKLKFHNKLLYAKIFAELLIRHLQLFYSNQKLPEVIIPIPLHHKRLQQRGFNQALELARPIAKNLKIPLRFDVCQRIRDTEAQSSIPAKQRQSNIKNAFALVKDLNATHIAVIDDVMTTGHTVGELSRMLRQKGIKQIDVWCCARTSKDVMPAKAGMTMRMNYYNNASQVTE